MCRRSAVTGLGWMFVVLCCTVPLRASEEILRLAPETADWVRCRPFTGRC